MKKIICLLLIIFLMGCKEDRKIRIRIIPNSNSQYDLLIKEKVKEETILFLEDLLVEKDTYDKAYHVIYKNKDTLLQRLKLIEESITVELKRHNMGNKPYNGKVENEENMTLLIKINNAQGDNWWGSLFPDFLGQSSSEKIEYKSWIKENIIGG